MGEILAMTRVMKNVAGLMATALLLAACGTPDDEAQGTIVGQLRQAVAAFRLNMQTQTISPRAANLKTPQVLRPAAASAGDGNWETF